MGLFGKKNNGDRSDSNEQNKESEGIKFPFLTILIEEVLSMTSTEVSVIGNVRGTDLKEGQELYLLGRKGKSVKTRALRIEDALMSKMPEAKEGENVSVVLEGLRSGDRAQSARAYRYSRRESRSPARPFSAGHSS